MGRLWCVASPVCQAEARPSVSVPHPAVGCGRYEDGKYKKKENTWRDFVACAEHLVNKGIADPDRCGRAGLAIRRGPGPSCYLAFLPSPLLPSLLGLVVISYRGQIDD
jgi:hypothetical protein